MKAIILAAGIGSRLGLKDIPKPMYEINRKPILEHNLLLLKQHEIKDICITLHHRGEVIQSYFNDGLKWDVKISYSYEKDLLGTSGALKQLEEFIGKEPFFVVYGDNYTNINLTEMLKMHMNTRPIATIAMFDPEVAINCQIAGGKISLDESNNLRSFIEGNNSNYKGYVNAGIYILEHKILNYIPGGVSDFGKNIFPKLLQEGIQMKGYITNDYVIAIDTTEALEIANQVAGSFEIKK